MPPWILLHSLVIVVIALHRCTEGQERYCSMASKFVFQISIKGFDEFMDDL